MTNPPWGPQDPQGPHQGPQGPQQGPPQQPWGQPPQGPPPQPPQGPPQQPTQQFPQQPYGQPAYGDPAYGPPGPGGQPGYDPQYGPQGSYGPQGPYGPPPKKSKTALFAGLGAVVVAGIVVLVLALTGVFGGDDGDGDANTPAAAVKASLDAAKSGNRKALLDTLCKADQAAAARGSKDGTSTDSKIDSYSIGKTTQQGDSRAKVDLTLKTTSGRSAPASYITVKEDGRWRVCIKETIASAGSSASSDDSDYDDSSDDSTDEPSDPASSDYDEPSSSPSGSSVYTYGGGGQNRTPTPGQTLTIPGGSTVVLPDFPTSR